MESPFDGGLGKPKILGDGGDAPFMKVVELDDSLRLWGERFERATNFGELRSFLDFLVK